ncbi:hypothetical protein PVK06_005159 [Gossypium arboreum]|uniref:Reverse transcriptase n=1 Tax=Gossypium arboreum TaxID=29729 RepID=A0ABR0QV50_GOSAR|nr:hypothetical protein PVK06_005159 [Gossypium arboreum]
MKILREFVQVLGQKINLDKSMVFFNPNTLIDQHQLYGDLLRMRVVDNLENYLGLPLYVGKKKSMAFHSILSRFSYRINSWSKRLFSYDGKDFFIKSIIRSLPTYALSIFVTPKVSLEEMQSKICRMWWICKDKGRRWAMLAWDKVCFTKGMGGLGFRDLRLFNLAFLGRLVWRLFTIKYTLCYHVLSSKYFPSGDLFHPKKVDKLSYTRTSIATAAKALENGFDWQVGDGNSIDIHKDNWGFEGLDGDSLRCTTLNFYERKVHDLWVNNRTSWNKNKVHEIYGCSIVFVIYLFYPMAQTTAWFDSITLMDFTPLSRPIRGFFLSRWVLVLIDSLEDYLEAKNPSKISGFYLAYGT